MSMEYCETCGCDFDTDYDVNGVYVTIPISKDEPESQYYVCENCNDKAEMQYESLEAAKADHYEAKRRGL